MSAAYLVLRRRRAVGSPCTAGSPSRCSISACSARRGRAEPKSEVDISNLSGWWGDGRPGGGPGTADAGPASCSRDRRREAYLASAFLP
ncbi:hypothetical protein [Ornithinimicrobium kibberense]|uniref:hypothetical protein n=1 Tax=Ornithinimicrobium kibberense TaxID=282060 RepID=UPI00361E0CC0